MTEPVSQDFIDNETPDLPKNSKPKSLKKDKFNPIGRKSVFFLIRHAERADDQYYTNNTIKKGDPDITEYGKIQALETGKSVMQKIMKLKRDKKIPNDVQPKIIVSPYWRTLKTAVKLLEGFGKNKIADNTIYIEVTLITLTIKKRTASWNGKTIQI